MRILPLLALACLLAGCATGPMDPGNYRFDALRETPKRSGLFSTDPELMLPRCKEQARDHDIDPDSASYPEYLKGCMAAYGFSYE